MKLLSRFNFTREDHRLRWPKKIYIIINYIISTKVVIEKGNIYIYLYNKGYKNHILNTKEDIIYGTYSIGICIKGKELMLINSPTVCYYMSRDGKVKPVEEIVEILWED